MPSTDKKKDWHPADIIASLRKKGTTLASVSRQAGLSPSTLSNTLIRPWPKGELLIAEALEVHPSIIWPSRYFNPKTKELLDRQQLIRPKKTTTATTKLVATKSEYDSES